MGLRRRLIELFKEKYWMIENKKVLVLGNLDEYLGYASLTLISGGFGFKYPLYIGLSEENNVPFSLFDGLIRKASDLKKFLEKKFEGATVEILEASIYNFKDIINLIKPDIVIDITRDFESYKLLKDYYPSSFVGTAVGDGYLLVARAADKLKEDVFNKEGGHLSAIILAKYIGAIITRFVLTNNFEKAPVIFGEGVINREIRDENLAIYGAGAIGNWFLEAILPYVKKAKIILIDYDYIEDHNVLRQQFFYPSDSGAPKVFVLKDRILKKARDIGAQIEVMDIRKKIEASTLEHISNKILSFVKNNDLLHFIYIDTQAGRYYSTKLVEKTGKKDFIIVAVVRTGAVELPGGKLFSGSLEELLSEGIKHVPVEYGEDVRNPSLRPGGISYPHGAIASLSAMFTLYKLKGFACIRVGKSYYESYFTGREVSPRISRVFLLSKLKKKPPYEIPTALGRLILKMYKSGNVNKEDIESALRCVIYSPEKVSYIVRDLSYPEDNLLRIARSDIFERVYEFCKELKIGISSPVDYILLEEIVLNEKIARGIIRDYPKSEEKFLHSKDREFIENFKKNRLYVIYLVSKLLEMKLRGRV